MSETEKKAAQIIDENDAARKSHHFKQIEGGDTEEFKKRVREVNWMFLLPAQRERAISLLRSGKAMTAKEARTLMQEEDFESRNTHR